MLPPGGRNRQLISPHYDKSTASFCHQVAAWVSDMFCNFYFVKNHKIANNSTTNKARLKISSYLESLEFQKCIKVYLTKLKTIKVYIIKLVTDFYRQQSYLLGERA